MKTLKLLTLFSIFALAISCSKDSVDRDQIEEQQIEQTSRSEGAFIDPGDSSHPSDNYPLGPGEAHVFVDYPENYNRQAFRNAMAFNFSIYEIIQPGNSRGICRNIELWIVNEQEYDYYIATGESALGYDGDGSIIPPADGASGQPVTRKQDGDDDDDQPRWACYFSR